MVTMSIDKDQYSAAISLEELKQLAIPQQEQSTNGFLTCDCRDSLMMEMSCDTTSVKTQDWKEDVDVSYKVDQVPPFGLCILLAFQHYISMFVASLTIPILLAPAVCMNEDNVGKSEITGTLFFCSGIITIVQTTVGIRLPIVQGGTFALLVPTLAYLNLPQWTCPTNILPQGVKVNASDNQTEWIETGSLQHRQLWMIRLNEIQGGIICASLFEILMGASGIIGIMLKYIGPLSICPTITMLGLSLFKSAAGFAAKQWWICLLTVVLMVVFSQYLGRVHIPCWLVSRENGCQKKSFPVFKMFAVIMSVGVSWLVCFILTLTNVLPNDRQQWGYYARTDLHSDAIQSASWFRIPYPGQWGMPTVSLSAVCAILSGVLATTVESVGDYHACAQLAGAPPPPLHAVNRGILVEGLGSLFTGIMGTGNGTTSTSINVGVVGITRVGSRRVVQCSAILMIVFGVFTKFGAFFIAIPDPVIGGAFFVLFGMIVAVGISSLQTVDMNSSRNLFIVGLSLFTGMAVPHWMSANITAINTGSQTIDNVFTVLLSTGMFIGGFVGFILDNTIKGTDEERGLVQWKCNLIPTSQSSQILNDRLSATYNFPFGRHQLERSRWFSYIPFCPTFMSWKKKTLNATSPDTATINKRINDDIIL